MAEESTTQVKDDNVIRMGVPGYGKFELIGTEAFLKECSEVIAMLTVVLLGEHVRQECTVKGRSIESVRDEFMSSFNAAVAATKAADGERREVSVSVT
jgi:hypothetical protein